MTLFHELFHVVLGNEKTEEHEMSCKFKAPYIQKLTNEASDELKYIANPRKKEGEDPGDENQDIISTQEALYNPESYTLYALACVLGQRNDRFTFASTRSELKKKEDPKDKDEGKGGPGDAGHRKRLLRV